MIVNGCVLRPIDAHDARKLPDGTVLICARALFEYRTGRPCGAKYYRCVVGSRAINIGTKKIITSEPDDVWPEMPRWRRGWTWLEGDSVTGFYVIERCP